MHPGFTEEVEKSRISIDSDTVVLIAEDDNCYFQLMKIMFNRFDIPNKLVRFKDGQEVLGFLEKGPYADYVLILDIRMPKMDGIEVLKRIRQSNKLKDIPVVIHSSTDNPNTVKLCQSLGCTDYIVKSGSSQEILQIFDCISQ